MRFFSAGCISGGSVIKLSRYLAAKAVSSPAPGPESLEQKDGSGSSKIQKGEKAPFECARKKIWIIDTAGIIRCPIMRMSL